MKKEQMYGLLAILLLAGISYYMYSRLVSEKAKNSISDTNTKAEVIEVKFKDVIDKEKQLAKEPVVPSNEDADKFWDRVLK